MYFEDQPRFLNVVAAVETETAPAELLSWLKAAEGRMGRVDAARNSPRVIDMDIVFYAGLVVSEPSLQIPHPRLAERAFVLVPLAEIRPGLLHPVLKKTVASLLRDLGAHGGVVRRPGVLEAASPSPPRRPAPPGTSPSRRGSSRGARRSSPRPR